MLFISVARSFASAAYQSWLLWHRHDVTQNLNQVLTVHFTDGAMCLHNVHSLGCPCRLSIAPGMRLQHREKIYIAGPNSPRTYFPYLFPYESFHGTRHLDRIYWKNIFTGNVIKSFHYMYSSLGPELAELLRLENDAYCSFPCAYTSTAHLGFVVDMSIIIIPSVVSQQMLILHDLRFPVPAGKSSMVTTSGIKYGGPSTGWKGNAPGNIVPWTKIKNTLNMPIVMAPLLWWGIPTIESIQICTSKGNKD